MAASRVLTHDEWINEFRPIKNPLDPSRISFGPASEELELLSQYPPQRVWSQLWDFYEERNVLVAGMYPPEDSEEDIYFVTESSWDHADIQVYLPYE